jgi:hypothetical protein
MNFEYFLGCILVAASMAVWPEIGLAHGGGGGGRGGHGGGRGGHGFGGAGGGHAFVGGGHEFGGFTDRGFSPGFRGTRGFFFWYPKFLTSLGGSNLGVGFRRYPAAFRPKNHTGERDSSTKGSTKSLGMLAQTFGKPDGAPRSQNALG